MSKNEIVKATSSSVPAELDDRDLLRLADTIVEILHSAISEIATRINMTMTILYWKIGQHIVEFEQQGNAMTKYETSMQVNLSKLLCIKLGKGYSRPNLNNMRKFYFAIPFM